LLINGLRVNLVEDVIEFVNVVNCEMHECAKPFSPCGFNGKCIPLSHTWRCICKSGLGGPKCEKDTSNAFSSRIAFNAYSFLTIERPKSTSPKLAPTLKMSANITKSGLGRAYELIFGLKLESTSRIQCIFVGVSGNSSLLGLDIWDLPVGWPPDRPISSSFVNYLSDFSKTRLSPAKWYKITLARIHNELGVYVDGKSCLTMGIQHFANHFYSRTTFYVGGAPQSIIDKFDFLQEMHPAIKRRGEIRGFVGCVEDIKLMDSPIRLANVTNPQNIDYCLDGKF
ncbi:Agrin, partial [Taenia solium]